MRDLSGPELLSYIIKAQFQQLLPARLRRYPVPVQGPEVPVYLSLNISRHVGKRASRLRRFADYSGVHLPLQFIYAFAKVKACLILAILSPALSSSSMERSQPVTALMNPAMYLSGSAASMLPKLQRPAALTM